MRPRIHLGLFLLKLGRFISSLPLMVMRPKDLLEFSRQKYTNPRTVEYWGGDKVVSGGLTPLEEMLLEKTGLFRGRVLVLGLGGGREGIPLAKRGFAVTGVDYIPAAVDLARKNAAQHGVHLDTQVGDYFSLKRPLADFDLAVFTSQMYSSIPTRQKRIALLKKIYQALKPGGWFICGFWWNPELGFSPRLEWLRKMVAYLSWGNLWYEPGDMLGGYEFIHAFQGEAELAAEFAAGGFAVTHLHIPLKEKGTQSMALLHKAA